MDLRSIINDVDKAPAASSPTLARHPSIDLSTPRQHPQPPPHPVFQPHPHLQQQPQIDTSVYSRQQLAHSLSPVAQNQPPPLLQRSPTIPTPRSSVSAHQAPLHQLQQPHPIPHSPSLHHSPHLQTSPQIPRRSNSHVQAQAQAQAQAVTPRPQLVNSRSSSLSSHPQVTPVTPQQTKKVKKEKKKSRYTKDNLPTWTVRASPRVTVEADIASTSNKRKRADSRPSATDIRQQINHTSAPRSGQPDPAPPEWECSIDNVQPYDEITRAVCDFLFEHVINASSDIAHHLEVEAKIGTLIDANTANRVFLPISNEAVLANAKALKFESLMNEHQHRTLNKYLNNAAMVSQAPGRVPLSYKHTRERDTFHDLPANLARASLPAHAFKLLNPNHTPRVRVTHDEKTGAELARIIKIRIADFNLYSPGTHYDVRISVNLEFNFTGNVAELPVRKAARRKDRMTYTHQAYRVDLTQVQPDVRNGGGSNGDGGGGAGAGEKRHELEVEVDVDTLLREGSRVKRGEEDNNYVGVVQGFLNNIRILTRTDPIVA